MQVHSDNMWSWIIIIIIVINEIHVVFGCCARLVVTERYTYTSLYF